MKLKLQSFEETVFFRDRKCIRKIHAEHFFVKQDTGLLDIERIDIRNHDTQ